MLIFATFTVASALTATSDVSTAPIFQPSDSIMIYSSPKTGTTTVQASVGRMMHPPCKVVDNDFKHSTRAVKCHAVKCAKAFLKRRPVGSRTWLISMVRSPFARLPSAFFQGIYERYTVDELSHVSVKQLLKEFREQPDFFPVPNGTNWFNIHYARLLGINITAYPFDFERKFLHVRETWQGRHLEIIVLRVEDTPKWEHVLKQFFPSLVLQSANMASDKPYMEKYKQFKDALKYTNMEIDHLRSGLGHFYTTLEADAIINNEKHRESARSASDESFIAADLIKGSDANDPSHHC